MGALARRGYRGLAALAPVLAAAGLGGGTLMACKKRPARGATMAPRAVGASAEASSPLTRVFAVHGDFAALPAPGPHDWRTQHPEPAQSLARFLAEGYQRPGARRRVLVLQPLGSFGPQDPSLNQLRACAAAHFALPVRVAPPVPLRGQGLTTRANPHTGHRQLLSTDVLKWLKRRIPSDAYSILAITMMDLYPEPSWNFVFGQASLRERVGVFSFARYDPAFHGEKPDRRLQLRRSCKVLVHETGHMFGLRHCVAHQCVMNGSNHLAESDARPLRFCPDCLRKLHASVGFQVVPYYRGLLRFFRAASLAEEARWTQKRLTWIERGGAR